MKFKFDNKLKTLDKYFQLPFFTPEDLGATVQIIEDSFFNGTRLTTLKLTYWRAIHGEFMTHRDFSRGASSSRAKPVTAVRNQVRKRPAGPIKWGRNQSGMQSNTDMSILGQSLCNFMHYKVLNKFAAGTSYMFERMGVHKQWANRYLENFERIEVIVSATSFKNFLKLRYHKDAQPEMQQLARLIKEALDNHQPRTLLEGEWHLPFVTTREREVHTLEECIIMSTARCARVSYGLFDGKPSNFDKDYDLYHKLVIAEPPHASPTEHPAQAMKGKWANFKDFRQHRWDLEQGNWEAGSLFEGLCFYKKPPRYEGQDKYPHYYLDVSDVDFVDVYRLIRMFGTKEHELEHAIKKLLCSGKRGAKGMLQDIKEAKDSLARLEYEIEHGIFDPE